MKDAINYFIPILKDPMNDITGRCMTNNALESAYCGSYHPMPAAKVINQPDMPMETNNMGMEIQYNNLIEIDDCQESQATPFAYQSSQPQRLQQNRKRNNYDCDIDSIANVKRCRREDADPSFFLTPEQCVQTAPALAKIQTHQRRPTHNMPDMPRCMMGHYV